jgi:5'-3' exonuclease
MLGLASHEVHFSILREEVLFGKQGKKAGYVADPVLVQALPDDELDVTPLVSPLAKRKPFQLCRIWVLREYLAHEFRPEAFSQPLPFEYSLERCIDDFVFMCFFVGNDFLPHLPSLSIREGGLELLLNLYRRVLPTLGGYLTEDGRVALDRVDVMMATLGTVEDEVFKRRKGLEVGETGCWARL